MSSSHLFFDLPIVLLSLYFELSSGFHSAAFFIHLSLVMSQFSMLVSISFSCVFCCSIESLHVPSCQLRQLGFFLCSRTDPLLQSQSCQYLFLSLHRMSLRCPYHLQIWCSDHRRFCHQCFNFQFCRHFLLQLYVR